MLRFLSLASVCLALSACMIYAPTYAPQTSTTVVHYETASAQVVTPELKQQTIEAKERVVLKQAPVKPTRSIDECKPFTLPRGSTPDFWNDDTLGEVKSEAEFDAIVVNHIKVLQTHIKTMNSRFEQAHAKWLESCKQNLLD